MASEGRRDRSGRLTEPRGGGWATSSQDYVCLAYLLFEQSASRARAVDGNCSIYSLAGIPVLFSALRALLIEGNSGVYGVGRDPDFLRMLSESANEIAILQKRYSIPASLLEKLALLYEVRNEIVHPAHMPAGTLHGTPTYLLPLRRAGLLQSSNCEDSAYTWIAQLQSHRLFGFAFETVEMLVSIILEQHHRSAESKSSHLQSYARYKSVDL